MSDPVFRALSDPTRREMLVRLARAPADVGELGRGFSMTQPAVSQHLKLLREAGLVEAEREGRRQIYRLRPERLRSAADWLGQFERFWDDRLDAIGRALGEET
jgi:DNA-binding transcriptional ArsR family regulator